ncbi:MAG: DUF4124 domain-containing protein, partial [Marinicella sp.]
LMLLLAVMISSQVLAEKIYKWVDENGQIHYSSSKPVDHEAETVKVRKGPKIVPKPESESTENTESTTNGEETTDPEDAEVDEAAEAEARKQLAAADRINNKKQCDLAQSNLNALNATVKITRKNEQGEMVRMSDDERVAAMKTAQQGVKQYCK